MESMTKRSSKPPNYAKIKLESRMALTNYVLTYCLSISQAAKLTGIKLSTAKLIIKKYKEEGTFFESKKDKQERLKTQKTTQQSQVNQQFITTEKVGNNYNMSISFIQNVAWPVACMYPVDFNGVLNYNFKF